MVMLACGWRHTLLGTANGDIFSWGRGVNGQLGHNEQRDLCAPPCHWEALLQWSRCLLCGQHFGGPRGSKERADCTGVELPA